VVTKLELTRDAEDDGTMPWDQTEDLFRTTLRAATEEVGPNVKVVDLGEAGKQEVWRQGTRSISKLIAKHGGKWSPHDTVHERKKSKIVLTTMLDHNTMMKWGPISLAVAESFGLTDVNVTRIAETPR
jgi:abhydrolase domain-containing protein 12